MTGELPAVAEARADSRARGYTHLTDDPKYEDSFDGFDYSLVFGHQGCSSAQIARKRPVRP